MKQKYHIGVIGLGYVGLPLFVHFSNYYGVTGYDLDKNRTDELATFFDRNKEFTKNDLIKAKTDKNVGSHIAALKGCDIFIITVPTPLTENNMPDLEPLKVASNEVAKIIKKGATVVYESTVYPGVTEEVCIPLIENVAGLKYNKDFFIGYSPERISPSDKTKTLENVVKIVSGSNLQTTKMLFNLYSSIIKAGVHEVSSIKTAEATKIIENIQRDVNIALMNELDLYLKKESISTREALTAAATKWNFLNFEPGLVGGHCIAVDPNYLVHRGHEIGFPLKLISTARMINEEYVNFFAEEIIKYSKKITDHNFHVLIMGYTFKEDCPDIRNSKIEKLLERLVAEGIQTLIWDPVMNKDQFFAGSEFEFSEVLPNRKFDVLVGAVRHREFLELSRRSLEKCLKQKRLVLDIKNFLNDKGVDSNL